MAVVIVVGILFGMIALAAFYTASSEVSDMNEEDI